MAHDPQPDPGDSSFIAMSSALVLFMTPGLAFYYGGMVREKNIINTMMMSLISMGVISVYWMAIGFSLSFEMNLDYVGYKGLTHMLWPATKITGLLFATFQMTFAIITVALISGALVERMRFQAYLVMITLWFFAVYVPLCYWVWGGGWIFQIGAKDFAGGTVVHISSGTAAIVGAAFLGKRKKQEHTPHNVPFVVLGGGILWFGWTGFNGGSALAANNLATLAVTTTFLAAATAMVAWVVLELAIDGKPTAIGAMTGAVSGLVGITPIAGFVSPIGALATGVVTAAACTGAVKLATRLKLVDDTLDCFTVHGVGGYIGAILAGFLDTKQGILYGANCDLMGAQIIGATSGMIYSGVCTALIFALVGSVMKLRVDGQIETDGLDKAGHAEAAYMMTVSNGNEEEMQQQRQLNEQMMTFMTSSQLASQREDPIRTLFCCAAIDEKPTAQAVQSFTTIGTSPRWQGN
jgi:Amt family ammonium transporter